MTRWISIRGRIALWLFLLGVTAQALAATSSQLVSGSDTSQAPPEGGNGDSCLPIISSDGRFVLFASTANNLVLATNDLPIPTLTPARLNVYLRDRSNATTVLVSVNLAGIGGGNQDSLPAGISLDARYALFESSASDLVAGDTNNASDIFMRDLVSGTTLLVSISTNGSSPPLPAPGTRSAVLTPDGRYVAFVSAANNLVANDANSIADAFVRDMQTGITTLASVGTTYAGVGSSSESPDITPDGRFVAFSTATTLLPGVRTRGDIYVRDLVAGISYWASAYARTALQSVTGQTNAVCFNHVLNADGRYVAYETSRSPLQSSSASGIILRYDLQTGLTDVVHTNAAVSGSAVGDVRSLDMTPDGRFIAFVANTNGISGTTTCLLVWDADTGTTALASGDMNNAVPANSICDWPALDASGRHVAFLSDAPGLVTNALVGSYHLYLRDFQAGTTMLVDADTNGAGSLVSCATAPRLSADARFVAFEGPDGQLVPNDCNGDLDVFVRDLTTGTNELVSAHDKPLTSPTANGASSYSANSLSADGRYVAFASDASNLTGTDTNGYRDVFLRDMAAGSNLLLSADAGGLPGNGISTEASISGDGRYVAFSSSATNLVVGDTNKVQDVFIRDLQTSTTYLVSRRADGSGAGNKGSYSPTLSTDGRLVMFRSWATDLASGTFLNTNLFVADLSGGSNSALTCGGVSAAAMTPNGRFVAFVGTLASTSTSYLYVWDSQSGARVYTNATTGITAIGISPDGNRVAYASSTSGLNRLWGADRAAQTNWLISTLSSGPRSSPRFNADGRWLAYDKANQVYLCDFDARTERLVSHAYTSSSTLAQGRSDSPDISPDGRFVAYRSLAPNVVANDTNGFSDVFLYDRLTGTNTLLSANCSGAAAANSCSFAPVFSADGQTLLFRTWASDVLPKDSNRRGHVFAYSLFTAVILPSAAPGQGPWISWPFVPGNTYRVQFKNHLGDPDWQDMPGSISKLGVKAWLQDPAPITTQRFYRIIAF